MRRQAFLYANILLVAISINPMAGQTKLDLSSQSRNVDFSMQPFVRPFPTGTVPPGTCNVGEMFFRTSTPIGISACVASNTWNPLTSTESGGSSESVGVVDVRRESDTQLTIGASCSISTPCVYRIGSVVYVISAPATATLERGSGTAYVYVDETGNILVGSSDLGVACLGCLVVDSVTQYPLDSIPLATWTATDGAWDSTETSGSAMLNGAPSLVAGSGISLTQTGSHVTIASTAIYPQDSGSGTPSTSGFDPRDPTQFYRDHLTLASQFNQGWDGWSYQNGCAGPTMVPPSTVTAGSMVPTVWMSTTTSCLPFFPTANGPLSDLGSYDYWSGVSPAKLWVQGIIQGGDTNGTLYVGLGSHLVWNATDFIGCRQIGSGNWMAVIHSGGIDVATADTGIPADGVVHRIVVDNEDGKPNTLRCIVDGAATATATGTIPSKIIDGWNYAFGATSSSGTVTNFGAYQYTIFLRGLPRK
jgi:hypothetical protein